MFATLARRFVALRCIFVLGAVAPGSLACTATSGSSGAPPINATDSGSGGAASVGQMGAASGGIGTGAAPTSSTGSTASTHPVAEIVARPPLRRLTHLQYNHAVRDLLGTAKDVAAGFAEDEKEAGFFSNSRQAVQALQLDQYAAAADLLASDVGLSALDATVGCSPQAMGEAPCFEQFITRFGRRAYRRPLSADETDRYKALFAQARLTGDFASGIVLVVNALLQSPNFLYRVELARSGAVAETDGAVPLSPYEIASRLSFLIWDSIPDDALLTAAESDQLTTPEQVAAVARSLLASPKARDTLADFHGQWLELESLAQTTKNNPTFTPDLRSAMFEEAVGFFDDVIRGNDGQLQILLTANYSMLKGPLYDLYGVPVPPGADATQLTHVDLPLEQHRAGALTLSALLSTHAHADQTSLVHRGKLIREQLLCQPIAPPPANVNAMPPTIDPNVSARVRFEQHRADPSCAACHSLMDPLGTPFEEFDEIGRYRIKDGTQAVDSSGEITGTTQSNGPVGNALELAQKLSTAEEVRQCVARQWFRYAFQRIETVDDMGTIDAALSAFQGSDYKIPELIVTLSTTRGFRYRLPVH